MPIIVYSIYTMTIWNGWRFRFYCITVAAHNVYTLTSALTDNSVGSAQVIKNATAIAKLCVVLLFSMVGNLLVSGVGQFIVLSGC